MALSASFPPSAGPARDAAILAAARAGQLTYAWSPITMGRVVVQCTTDGVKLDGVRLAGSAQLCQQVADLLGACLQTPKINDQCWIQGIQIPPQTIVPNTTDTATMARESALVDAAVAGRAGLVAPIGKPWVLAKAITATKAALYGWQSPTALYASPATPGVRVIQPLSTAHSPQYVDYSSSLSFVARACTVDGVARDLVDVLQDPVLSLLVSHEGVVPVRQPGVPTSAPLPSLVGMIGGVSPGLVVLGASFVLAGFAGWMLLAD